MNVSPIVNPTRANGVTPHTPQRGIVMEQVLVTPELAERWLALNKNVRAISEPRVALLARLLATRKWELTHQGVAFDCDGFLIDGQHRLSAIVRARRPAEMIVTRGLSSHAVGAIDCGAARSAPDVLRALHADKLEGRNAARFSAVCIAIDLLESGARVKADPELALEVYERHQQAIDWVFELFPGRHSIPATAASALAWARPAAPEHLDRFGRQLADCYMNRAAAPQPGPSLALYSAIVRRQQNGDSRLELMHKTLRAAMAFCRGERLTRIDRGSQGYEFFRARRAALGLAGGQAGS